MFTPPPNAGPPQMPVAPMQPGPPQNDAQLQAYLQSVAPVIKNATGKEHQNLSDTIYRNIRSYSKANPQSVMAKQALESAHKNAPKGHKFPS